MDIRQRLTVLMPELVAYARAIARDRSDADDLVGDAIERAMKAAAPPAQLDGLRPWLFRVIRNLHIDEMRKRKVRSEYSEAEGRHSQEAGGGRNSTADRVLARIAFEKLDPPAREILFLVDVMGMKYAEAADVLDMPNGTVMSRVSRARRALLALIDDTNVTSLDEAKKKGRG